MSYTKKTKEKAYLAYRETGNFSKAAEIAGVPEPTLYSWAKRYKWNERVENSNEALIESPLGQDKNVETLCNSLKIPKRHPSRTVLKQIKAVEAVCMFTIKKGKNEAEQRFGLYPMNFDSAAKVLKQCWDTRIAILQHSIKNEKPQISIQSTGKINLIGMVKEGMDADTPDQGGRVLPGQETDSEWEDDYESE